MTPEDPTENPAWVLNKATRLRAELFPPPDPKSYLDAIFADVAAMFAGRAHDFQPIDTGYHDFGHTLQATSCLVDILVGYQTAAASHPTTSGRLTPPTPLAPLTPREFDLGVTAAMFHDTGYLRTRSDTEGTGAKYTHSHVLRSCAVAATVLPRHGVNLTELETVLNAIRSTGPTAHIAHLHFPTLTDRFLAAAVATADYLGQMASPSYPDKLTVLFREFEESDNYLHRPPEQRLFRSPKDLIAKTPAFWTAVVQPKLDADFAGVHRYLARPYPAGPNPYLNAIHANLARIQEMATAPDS